MSGPGKKAPQRELCSYIIALSLLNSPSPLRHTAFYIRMIEWAWMDLGRVLCSIFGQSHDLWIYQSCEIFVANPNRLDVVPGVEVN